VSAAANLRGGLVVTFSMAAFAVEDALIKDLTTRLPLGEVMLLLGLGGAAVFFAIIGDAGRRGVLRGFRSGTVMFRNLAECVSGATFIPALALVPISTVAAVFQATPLAITAAAALFLGETVGWRRWSAVTVGFIGVLMIIRPGLEGFEPAAALVLVTVVSIAFRDIITRRVPADLPSGAVACHGFLAVAVIGLGFLALSGGAAPLSLPDLGKMAAAVAAGTSGYYAIVAAMRIGDASALMPYRYSRLIFSMMIGMAFFAERPDALTLAGAALILAAAFYTYLRERRVSRAHRAAPAE
jgi:drug/metabolite transporter (DMT)-like permease